MKISWQQKRGGESWQAYQQRKRGGMAAGISNEQRHVCQQRRAMA